METWMKIEQIFLRGLQQIWPIIFYALIVIIAWVGGSMQGYIVNQHGWKNNIKNHVGAVAKDEINERESRIEELEAKNQLLEEKNKLLLTAIRAVRYSVNERNL